MHAFYAGFINVDNVAAQRSRKGLSMPASNYQQQKSQVSTGFLPI